MGLISLIKSALGLPEVPEEPEEQAEENAVEVQIVPAFNAGVPIEIMSDYDTVLIRGKLDRINAAEMVVERIPGAMSFAILEVGSTVLVRGYNNAMSPIILEAKVVKSSVIECVLSDWLVNFYDNQRRSIRYPVDLPAEIYLPEDTRLNAPQKCRLVNISTGGASISSEYVYEMGQALRLRVELVENSGHSSYQCQVVRVISRKDDQFEYGLLFAQLDRKKMNELTRDIESIQQDTKKKLLS